MSKFILTSINDTNFLAPKAKLFFTQLNYAADLHSLRDAAP